MITLTPSAMKEAKRLLSEQPRQDFGLRIGVRGGGCSGLSYSLNFDIQHEGDNVFEFEESRVFVDPKSLLYLDGLTLDFSNSLEGRGFKFLNPNATKSCGCGESFSV